MVTSTTRRACTTCSTTCVSIVAHLYPARTPPSLPAARLIRVVATLPQEGAPEVTDLPAKFLEELEQLDGEELGAYNERLRAQGKAGDAHLTNLSRKLWLANQTPRAKKTPREERVRCESLASKQLRAQALAAIPEPEIQAFREVEMEPVHESSNTVGWLEDSETAELRKREFEDVVNVWALVFRMPRDAHEIWLENERLTRARGEFGGAMHITTETEEDLTARTVHLGLIPAEHVVSSEVEEPSLSSELMRKLSERGDVDTVTVRERAGIMGLSWALVTYERKQGAVTCIEDGISVSGADHSTSANQMVPEKALRVSLVDIHRESHGSFDSQLFKHEGRERHFRAMPITHEAWATVTRCLACDLEVGHHVTADRKHLIITLAATVDVLIQEAKLGGGTLMRLKETKGALAFHPDLVQYFSHNHGGLNECPVSTGSPRGGGGLDEHGNTKWNARDDTLAPDWAKRPVPDPTGKDPWEFPDDPSRKIFTSALAQVRFCTVFMLFLCCFCTVSAGFY